MSQPLLLTFSVTSTGQIVSLQIDPYESIENIKALLEVETGITIFEQRLYLENRLIEIGQDAHHAGIKNGDMIRVERVGMANPSMGQPSIDDAIALREHIMAQPGALSNLERQMPRLHQALVNNNLEMIREFLVEMDAKRARREVQEQNRIAKLNADPLNPENQMEIAETIRKYNVDENLETALETVPEMFGSVTMLWIDVEINHVPMKAFVDSGAQMTIMTPKAAEQCGIARLMDSRHQGVAVGVGSAKIIGRVHVAPLKMGHSIFNCSFVILEGGGNDFILGLDMLRRHQAIIDLKSGVLRMGDESIPFLAEKDIPKSSNPGEASGLFPVPQSPGESSGLQPVPGSTDVGDEKESVAPPPPATTTQPDEAAIAQVQSLGFDRDTSIAALVRANGNVDMAVSILMGF